MYGKRIVITLLDAKVDVTECACMQGQHYVRGNGVATVSINGIVHKNLVEESVDMDVSEELARLLTSEVHDNYSTAIQTLSEEYFARLTIALNDDHLDELMDAFNLYGLFEPYPLLGHFLTS